MGALLFINFVCGVAGGRLLYDPQGTGNRRIRHIVDQQRAQGAQGPKYFQVEDIIVGPDYWANFLGPKVGTHIWSPTRCYLFCFPWCVCVCVCARACAVHVRVPVRVGVGVGEGVGLGVGVRAHACACFFACLFACADVCVCVLMFALLEDLERGGGAFGRQPKGA